MADVNAPRTTAVKSFARSIEAVLWHSRKWRQPAGNGVRVALIGYLATIPVVVGALTAAGAQPGQVSSVLFVLGLCMGLPALILSLRYRTPLSVAWSTAGAAVLVAHGPVHGGLSTAAGAFMIAGLLTVLAGLCTPVAKWVSAVPICVANALLAGVLLGLCVPPVRAFADGPALIAPVLAAWLLVRLYAAAWAIPAAICAALAVTVLLGGMPQMPKTWDFPTAALTVPRVDVVAALSLALPLFLVTMLSQNVPALGVLRGQGFEVSAAPVLLFTGVASVAGACFGALGVSLAAVTAAMCAGVESGPDPQRRWVAAAVAGVCQIVLALGSGVMAMWILALPSDLVGTVASLALTGTLVGALARLVHGRRNPATILATVLVTAVGGLAPGAGGPLWGLGLGLILHRIESRFSSRKERMQSHALRHQFLERPDFLPSAPPIRKPPP